MLNIGRDTSIEKNSLLWYKDMSCDKLHRYIFIKFSALKDNLLSSLWGSMNYWKKKHEQKLSKINFFFNKYSSISSRSTINSPYLSGMMLMARCLILPKESEDFIADHPFIILLEKSDKNSTNTQIMFMGKISRI